MELVVANFIDPVATVVVVESQHSLVSLAQIPDAHCTVSPTGGYRVQSTLIVGNV